MKTIIILFCILLLVSNSLQIKNSHLRQKNKLKKKTQAGQLQIKSTSKGLGGLLIGFKYTFQADTGNFLSRCNGCYSGGAYPDSAFAHVANTNSPPGYSLWTVVDAGNGLIALKSDTGNYLARCNGCAPGCAKPNQAFVHVANYVGAPYAQWTVVDLLNGKIQLKADNGLFLARCNSCTPGEAYPDSVTVHGTDTSNWATWTPKLQLPGGLQLGFKYSFQADTGNLLSRCNGCYSGGAYPDSAFVHVANSNSPPGYSLWTVVNAGNGLIALKADTGNYLARCNGCAPNCAKPNQAFVHVSSYVGAPYAQWTVVDAGNGKIQLKADNGLFLARCNGCTPGEAYPDSVTVHGTDASAWAVFTPKLYLPGGLLFGKQFTFQADTGNLLSRCNGCYSGGAYPDSAFVHVANSNSPPGYSLWTVVNAGNGFIALKSDTGNYLARCNGCAPGCAKPNQAFVHVANFYGAPYAQWAVVDAGNGMVQLKADNGLFLARCNSCTPGEAYPDSATVHGTDASSWVLWKPKGY